MTEPEKKLSFWWEVLALLAGLLGGAVGFVLCIPGLYLATEDTGAMALALGLTALVAGACGVTSWAAVTESADH